MSTRQKTSEQTKPRDKKLEDAYFKRYGVFYPKRIAKKLAIGVVFSLRELYNIFRGRNSDE